MHPDKKAKPEFNAAVMKSAQELIKSGYTPGAAVAAARKAAGIAPDVKHKHPLTNMHKMDVPDGDRTNGGIGP